MWHTFEHHARVKIIYSHKISTEIIEKMSREIFQESRVVICGSPRMDHDIISSLLSLFGEEFRKNIFCFSNQEGKLLIM